MKCEWYDYDFEVVLFAKDVEKYISSLVESWAWEFFVWYNPNYWSDKFGFEVSPNGRFSEHEQVTDYETLKR